MVKVIAACGNGMGSSQMIKMKIEKVFKKLGQEVQIEHNSVGAATSMATNFDAVFVSLNFVEQFSKAAEKGVKIIGLKNLLSEKEIEEKILESGLIDSPKIEKTFSCEVDCANCANKVEEALKKVDGIDDCSIDFMRGKCKITFNKELDETLKKEIVKTFKRVDSDSEIEI